MKYNEKTGGKTISENIPEDSLEETKAGENNKNEN